VRLSTRAWSVSAALVPDAVLPPQPCHWAAKTSGKTMVELSCTETAENRCSSGIVTGSAVLTRAMALKSTWGR
jgi:hypothetical protein